MGVSGALKAFSSISRASKKLFRAIAAVQKSRAHYEKVSTGETGHAESVQITFDPKEITYGQLLKVYFSVAQTRKSLTSRAQIAEPNTARSFFTRMTNRKKSRNPTSSNWTWQRFFRGQL